MKVLYLNVAVILENMQEALAGNLLINLRYVDECYKKRW